MAKAQIVTTPTNLNVHLSVSHEDDDEQKYFFPCQEVVGSFMFVMIDIFLDITYTINMVEFFSKKPKRIHCIIMKKIFKYLEGTTLYSLCYSQRKKKNVTSFANVDYVGDFDDQKSRSGCVLIFNHETISSVNRKKLCTTRSTTKSKYIVVCLTTQKVVWTHCLLVDIGHT